MVKLKSIGFKNYKAFKENQRLDVKPITILIGKNSSGKSAVSKLPLLLSKSFTTDAVQPIKIRYNDVEFAGTFTDLIYNKFEHGSIEFNITFIQEDNSEIKIGLEVQNFLKSPIQAIVKWSIDSSFLNINLTLDLSQYVLSSTSDLSYQSPLGTLKVNFKGAIPSSIENNTGELLYTDELVLLSKALTEWSQNVNYIGPFRAFPERIYRHLGQVPEKIGHKGEFAPQILGMSSFLPNDTIENVGNWFKENLGGWELAVDNSVNSFEIVLISPDNQDVKVNIVDVGQGMSQVLPLIVRCFGIGAKNSLDIIEQPELHLHPAAHGALAELFCLTAKNNGSFFIIETHSENFILRIRRLIVERKIDPEDVVIYWIDDEVRPGSSLNKITITIDGELSEWPSGVFSEDHEEVLAIKKALRERQ